MKVAATIPVPSSTSAMRSALQSHSRQFSRGNSSVLLSSALPVHTTAFLNLLCSKNLDPPHHINSAVRLFDFRMTDKRGLYARILPKYFISCLAARPLIALIRAFHRRLLPPSCSPSYVLTFVLAILLRGHKPCRMPSLARFTAR